MGELPHGPTGQVHGTGAGHQRFACEVPLPNLLVARLPAPVPFCPSRTLRSGAAECLITTGRNRRVSCMGRDRGQAPEPGMDGV